MIYPSQTQRSNGVPMLLDSAGKSLDLRNL
jgi:hypothetical protein